MAKDFRPFTRPYTFAETVHPLGGIRRKAGRPRTNFENYTPLLVAVTVTTGL